MSILSQLDSIYIQCVESFTDNHSSDEDYEAICKKLHQIEKLLTKPKEKVVSKHRFLLPFSSDYTFADMLKSLLHKETKNTVDLFEELALPNLTFQLENKVPSPCFTYVETGLKKGIYISPVKNLYVKVDIAKIEYMKDTSKFVNTVACRYRTRENCEKHIGERYCTFVHEGERYSRIGNVTRCPSLPRFGNKQQLAKDILTITPEDVNCLLMHSVSDLFLVALWHQHNFPDKVMVFDNIDKLNPLDKYSV
jgi:hypothetical protein